MDVQSLISKSHAQHADENLHVTTFDTELNLDFTDAEVFGALRHLHNGKVSYDINPDILKYAADAFNNNKLR